MPSFKNLGALRLLIVALLVSSLPASLGASTNTSSEEGKVKEFLGSIFDKNDSDDQDVEISKEIDSTFQATQDLRVDLINKYGQITVDTWDQSNIEVRVLIRVRDKDEKKASKILDQIDIEMQQYGSFLDLRTHTDEGTSQVTRFFRDITPFDKTKVDIDYVIKAPSYIEFKIENKFGNVYLNNLAAPVTLNLSYGDLRCNPLPGGSDLDLSFCQADIRTAPQADIEIHNGGLDLKDAGSIDLVSSSSEIDINDVVELRVDARRDQFQLEEVGLITGKGQFSEIEIESLSKSLDLDLAYGDLEIEGVMAGFTGINIEQRNVDVEIHVPGASFDLMAHLEGGSLLWPGETSELEVQSIDVKKEIRTISGSIAGGGSDITLDGKGGVIAFYK